MLDAQMDICNHLLTTDSKDQQEHYLKKQKKQHTIKLGHEL